MATLVSPVAFPDESQLRQASLITLIVVIVACAVVLIAIIGGLMCLFFCYRQKRCVLLAVTYNIIVLAEFNVNNAKLKVTHLHTIDYTNFWFLLEFS